MPLSSINTNKINNFFAFTFGLLSATNAIYIFVVGSTPIHPLTVVSLVYLFYLSIRGKMNLSELKRIITPDIWLLLLSIFLSIFSVLISDYHNVVQWAVGIISVLLFSFVVLAVICNGKAKDSLFYGIIFGIFLNAIFCLVDFVLREKGIVLSLKDYFPASNIVTPTIYNSYAAKGFFKEQGHLMRYLAVFFLPVLRFSEKKSKLLYFVVFFAMILMMVMTKSASLAIFIVGYMTYLIYSLITNPKKVRKKIKFLIILSLIVLFFSNFIEPLKNILSSFTEGINDIADSKDHGNVIRVSGFTYTINIIKDYPIIGTGWNTLSKMFMSYGYYGVDNVFGSYSAALSLVAELGVFSLFYFYFIISKSFRLIGTKKTEFVALGFAILIYFAIFCSTDFVIDAGSSVFLGIVFLNYRERTRESKIRETVFARGINYDYYKNTI